MHATSRESPDRRESDLTERGDAAILWRGLSARLLVLTVIFVMIAEVLIFLPSIANFRNVWLQGHLDTAETASIVYLDSDDPMLSDRAQREFLSATQSLAVVIREGAMSRMMASTNAPFVIDESYDLTVMRPFDSVVSALSMLFSSEPGIYRVFGPMKSRPAVIELVQRDGPLRAALRTYSRNVALLSLAISFITAALVFFALYWMIVRPIRRLSLNMTAFSREPDNAALILRPSGRGDEIGVAEHRLAAFETDLHRTLRQRQHLADLGLAVSKINHDLRNILASAQLFSDRLSNLPDPTVQRLAPKLLRAINRAAGYSQSVLAYGRAREAAPERRLQGLRAIVEDVGELLALEGSGVEWVNEVPEALQADIDAEQLFRVIMNLCRNAVQAMERATMPCRLAVSALRKGDAVELRIADTGPGIGEKVRAELFKPFGQSARSGGTGLGLVIAAELVRAHGGTIAVERTSGEGTTFLVVLPDRAGEPGGR
ncbi:MAG: HAMP domain-containing sensor histidine kinase [Pseudomonadota bacterium]|nr:HAMP domain-containing sensor histidine kinase [Pseudomonadota bacterium]